MSESEEGGREGAKQATFEASCRAFLWGTKLPKKKNSVLHAVMASAT